MKVYIPNWGEFVKWVFANYNTTKSRKILRDVKRIARKYGNPKGVEPNEIRNKNKRFALIIYKNFLAGENT